LIQVDNVNNTDDAKFYIGKKVAYIYSAKVAKNGSKFRCVWGKVTANHGNAGVVRCKFSKNLDPKTIGSSVRIMLYPSLI
jgi:large subunit ribosomal protein L35Ae